MMKERIIIISILIFLTTSTFASQAYTATIAYKNILLVYTGSTGIKISYDDSIKYDFIVKRVFELSKRYNYKRKIILNYQFSNENQQFFISFSKPILFRINHYKSDITKIDLLSSKRKVLYLTAIDKNRKQKDILKIVEFSLKNLDSIKEMKQDIIAYKNYLIHSIDTNFIKKIIPTSKESEIVKEVLDIKLYRELDNKEFSSFLSYYTKNDLYFPYSRVTDMYNNTKEITLDTLDEIRYYANANDNLFIFPNDINTFNFYTSYKTYKNLKIIKDDSAIHKNLFLINNYISVEEIMSNYFLLKFSCSLLSVNFCVIFSGKEGVIGLFSGNYYINEYLKKE